MSQLSKIDAVMDAYFQTLAKVSENPRATADNISPAEVELAIILNEAWIPYEQQVKIGPFYADFYFRKANLVIEIDGASWHQDWARDKRRSEYLIAHGIKRVIHMSANAVFTDGEGCLRAIRYYLEFP